MMTPCVEHSGARDKDGYGMRYIGRTTSKNGKRRPAYARAHRHAWEAANGPIPSGLVVMHICDNPPCVNLDHLQLGTVAENNHDRSLKGRTARHKQWQGPRLFGEQHSQAKLTETDVVAIRNAIAHGAKQADLARAYGITPGMVTRIKQGIAWAHLPLLRGGA